MPTKITIKTNSLELAGTLNDSATAQAIVDALPIKASANCWGDEIYFAIPVNCPLADDARDLMEVGELAYWPPGKAFCIFWGSTPASTGDEPRAASDVNPIGRIEPTDQLHKVNTGDPIQISLREA
jgi:hypothetical protein